MKNSNDGYIWKTQKKNKKVRGKCSEIFGDKTFIKLEIIHPKYGQGTEDVDGIYARFSGSSAHLIKLHQCERTGHLFLCHPLDLLRFTYLKSPRSRISASISDPDPIS